MLMNLLSFLSSLVRAYQKRGLLILGWKMVKVDGPNLGTACEQHRYNDNGEPEVRIGVVGLGKRLLTGDAVRAFELLCRCPTSGVHIVVLSILVISRWWRGRPLLHQLLSVQRTSRVEFQPRLDALQIEQMVLVARQPDDQGIRI